MSQLLPRLTLISYAAPIGDVAAAMQQIHQQDGKIFELHIFATHLISAEPKSIEPIMEIIRSSKAVLFDLRGMPDYPVALIQRSLQETQGQDIAFIPVFGGGPSILALTRMGSFSMANQRLGNGSPPSVGSPTARPNIPTEKPPGSVAPPPSNARPTATQIGQGMLRMMAALPPETQRHVYNWQRCMNYWTNGGVDNLANLLRFVAAEYAGVVVTAAEPEVYPDSGFLHLDTGKRYASYIEYISDHPLNPLLPTVAVVIYSGTSMAANLMGGQELFAELAAEANVLCFFADGIGTADAMRQHFFHEGRAICDALVSLLWFRLDGGPMGGDERKAIALLQDLDIPYYVAITSNNREIALWEQSAEGLPPVETLATVAFPELDGAIDPIIVYGLAGENTVPTPVVGRGKRLARRILKRVTLQRKVNAEKRVAIVLFNYPPGEGTLGTASFLDVFASVERILKRLQQGGYTVTPPAAGTLKDRFLQAGLLHHGEFTSIHLTGKNAIHIPYKTYLRWYEQLPQSLRQSTENTFGLPPGNLMVEDGDLLIAGIEFGNVVVAIQPSRGVHEDPSKIHHDDSLPAHHQYIAFYRWLEETDGWNADAVVHVGTHGTFEFLPGKQVALANDSVPDALLGSLPHIYLYHVVNVSEGTIAKRRSYAQLISYASPTFAPAGLYKHLNQLEELIDEYEEQRQSKPRAIAILRQIATVCQQHDIILELTDELRDRLLSETDSLDLQPYESALEDLHIRLFELKRVAIPMGLHTFGERLKDDALVNYLNLIARYDRSETPSLPRLLAQQHGWDYDRLLDTGDHRVETLARQSQVWIERSLHDAEVHSLDPVIAPALQFLKSAATSVEATDEIGSLLHALEGRYVEPGVGGDPVRSPQTYPTGRNTCQFDPTKLPTDSACERGAQIADATLNRYFAEHGSYPDAVGVILWGFETCKTYGETIGQILHYIGVRLDRGQGYFPKPVVIPLEELGRPRVDVTINICGFFRDLFPNLVRAIDLAFQTVAQLEEPLEQNAVRRHALALATELGNTSDAKRLSTARLFGPPPGEYGNSLSTMIETAAWEDAAELGEMYLKRTQYLYGDRLIGTESRPALTAALHRTQIITQVRDSHEFEVTDIDHYYEFFGGMAQATMTMTGNRPPVLIADTTKERIQVKTLSESVAQGITSRLLNPKWIDAMLKHDHKGGQAIADRVEYLIGLDATTASVGAANWRKVANRFVLDAEMRQRLIENNPFATAELIRKLGEAEYRGYWQPTSAERRQLQEIYHDLEAKIEQMQIERSPAPQTTP
jgi:magnesium chelatase H subunit